MKRIMIYGKTLLSAERHLGRVMQLTGVQPEQVSEVRRSKDLVSVKMLNGDYYEAIVPSLSSKGIKTTYAFIDLEIDSQLIYDVLIPTVIYGDNVFFYR